MNNTPTNGKHTYYRWPSPQRGEFNREFGGIVEALRNYTKLLPEYGWTEVHDENEADLVVGHLGTGSKRLDVFHCHGLYPTGEPDFASHNYAGNAKVIENIRRSRHVIAVSDWVADILRRDMHLDPWVLGHGFDVEKWNAVPEGAFSEEPFALWNKTRAVGVCNPEPVVELARRFPKFRFVTTFLPRRGASATSNITLTGLLKHEDAWKVVKDCTIYLGTTKETFGIGTLEAMASGAVVVGFRWGATPEVVGDCGLLVEPGNYDALAQAFAEALDRCEELGQKAIRRVREQFSWHVVTEKLADLYRIALEDRERVRPKITVIIPCFNYMKYIDTAIQCVQLQTLKDLELIVVDDGSTDNSAEVIRDAIKDMPNAKLIQQENMGVAHARNRGIAAGMGEYICCLDADDGIAPTFLEILSAALDEDASLGIAYTGLKILSGNNKVLGKGGWPKPFNQEEWIGKNQIPTCCVFRRTWWERVGGYRQRYAPHGAGQEDADFWLRILARGGGAKMATPERLFYYRVHKDQTTRTYPEFWSIRRYLSWHPYAEDEKYPLASQIGKPKRETWPVLNYDRPAVSVIVPVGPGHEHCLVDALDSVEAQTFRKWELVVVNDTEKELNLKPWPFARLVGGNDRHGPGAARNRGTLASTAPLVVYLDADDALQPHYLEHSLAAWEECGGERWIYTDLIILHEDGSEEIYKVWDWDVEQLWRGGLAAVTCLFSRKMWEKVDGFDETLIAREDWDFHLRLARAGYCGLHLPIIGFTYRHATGQRRSEGQGKFEARTLRDRYPLKELQMARRKCRGCTQQKRATAPRQNPGSRKNGGGNKNIGMVPMEYQAQGKPDISYRGRGGRIYRVGSRNRRFWAHPEDVKKLLRLGSFRRLRSLTEPKQKVTIEAKPKPVSVIVPVKERVVANSSPAIDNSTPDPGFAPVAVDSDISANSIATATATPEPSELTVTELKKLELSSKQWSEVLEREKSGKARKTAIAVLEEKVGKGELVHAVDVG